MPEAPLSGWRLADSLDGPASAPVSPWRVPLLLLGAVALLALLGPLIAPQDPLWQDLAARNVSPRPGAWLGTDNLGRDVLSRLLAGARITVLVASGATALALAVGAALGLTALAAGALPASLVFGVIDLIRALPSVLLGLALMVALGTGVGPVTIAIGLSFAPTFAVVARQAWLRERAAAYVEAAVASGTHPAVILRRHIAPNVAGALITQAAIILPRAVTTESVLSFLGLGVSPETPTWGRMIAAGLPFVERAPHAVLAPVIALSVLTLLLALAGDRIRAAADPLRMGTR
ncbi:ABC transporter permease [Elioraea tepidiphila]|jgi:ABC-type dipeptide/oligopeptide/nickel transport system permease subunit|uniref:ABC transporter permease n=1 Tax=Elioraea tepidiphila TaxID=457934 RepID=UPI000368136F|nr:ABC transporter permease [Elioraea tepidiphila]